MTWAAWGLILDIVGALLIAAATMEAGVDGSGYLSMYRRISHPKLAFVWGEAPWLVTAPCGFRVATRGRAHRQRVTAGHRRAKGGRSS